MKPKYKLLLNKYSAGLEKLHSQNEVLKFNEDFREVLKEYDIDMDALSLGAHMFIRHSYKNDDLDWDKKVAQLDEQGKRH